MNIESLSNQHHTKDIASETRLTASIADQGRLSITDLRALAVLKTSSKSSGDKRDAVR